jgi:hypothetical protein
MPDKPNDVVNRLQQLASEASAQQARLIHQYADLYQKFANNEITAVDPAAAAHFWLTEGSDYAQKIIEMNLSVYNQLFDIGRGVAERYVKLVGSTSAKKAPAASQPAAAAAAVAASATTRKASKARRTSTTKK